MRYAYDRFEPVSERFLLEGEKKKAVGALSFYIAPIGVAGEVTWSQVVEVPFDGCATSPKTCKACVRHTLMRVLHVCLV